MAFFKFRKNSDAPTGAPVQPDSVERMRQRAKYRLIGASVLVLLGVVGFPLLFDKQPRPIAVDTPIDIPDKNKVAPLVIPSLPASQAMPDAPAKTVASAPQSVVITETAEPPKLDKVLDKKTSLAHVNNAQDAPKTVAKEVPKPVKPPALPAVKPTEADKAQALLDGKTAAPAPVAGDAKFIVQVGAFADAARVKEVRQKLEHAGLKTYTNVAETKDGKRTRVRVGPFVTRAEAEKAAEKIKKLSLSAALLTL
jgi:DedD protein